MVREARAELLLLMFPVLMMATDCGRPGCDFPPAQVYYGILGEATFLHVPVPSATQRFSLEKEKRVILEEKAEAGSDRNLHTHGVEVFLGGTLKISHCLENHSGEYRWRTFGSDGGLQCDINFTLLICDLCSPDLHSFSQPPAKAQRSSNITDQSSTSLLTSDCSPCMTEQICVNRKVFLLLCGVLAVFFTLITALSCLTMALKSTSPCSQASPGLAPGADVIYSEVSICQRGKRNRAESETPRTRTTIYSEVAQEVNSETGNQTFSTYGLN